jgi:hypothetical protein
MRLISIERIISMVLVGMRIMAGGFAERLLSVCDMHMQTTFAYFELSAFPLPIPLAQSVPEYTQFQHRSSCRSQDPDWLHKTGVKYCPGLPAQPAPTDASPIA